MRISPLESVCLPIFIGGLLRSGGKEWQPFGRDLGTVDGRVPILGCESSKVVRVDVRQEVDAHTRSSVKVVNRNGRELPNQAIKG